MDARHDCFFVGLLQNSFRHTQIISVISDFYIVPFLGTKNGRQWLAGVHFVLVSPCYARGIALTIQYHKNDLPDDFVAASVVAIDTETLGLNPHRDRLCVVQLSNGDGTAHVVQIGPGQSTAPNLVKLLADPNVIKLFHYARFDLATLAHAFGVMPKPVYCTKVASKLARTYTDRHGLKDLVKELLNIDLSKQQQSSDWGADHLSEAQLTYAASDVLHLHALMDRLNVMLARENRAEFAKACQAFLPTRAALDLAGWPEMDIFAHS